MRTVSLEVVGVNDMALRLYERIGFRCVFALPTGWLTARGASRNSLHTARSLTQNDGSRRHRPSASTLTAAFVQMAWKYGRNHHLIVHREDYPEPLLLHLIAHELGHLRLEAAARAQGRNKLFVSTDANQETAIRSMTKDVARWQRKGLNDEAITELTGRLIDGIARQIFNAPIDMLIEAHLHRESPKLQASQFLSLAVLAREAEQASMDSEIRRQLPRHITAASAALNGATALFLDRLYAGATTYADVYRRLFFSRLTAAVGDTRRPFAFA